MTSVLTVILNWRTAEMSLRACKTARTAMEGVEGAITIVDNDSGDGSFGVMSAAVRDRGWDQGPNPVRVLQSGANGGFGAGNNFGILAGLPGGVRPDYAYILNSDAFPEPGAIRALRDHLDAHPATGFAGSFIYGEDGEPQRTAFRFPSPLGEFEAAVRFGPVSRLLHDKIVAQPIPETTCSGDWLSGASMMMRMDALDDTGLFDPAFFLYFEETDLCLRAARKGWPCDFVRESVVMHIGSVTTGLKERQRIPKFWLDSRRHYFTKNHGHSGFALATLAHAFGAVLWRMRLLVQHKDRQDPPHFLRDLIRHAVATGGNSPTAQGGKRNKT